LKNRDSGLGARGSHASPRHTHTALAVACALALVAVGCATTRPVRRAPTTAHGAPAVAAPGAVEEGLASWYGEPYHGRPTASGPRYDMWAMTAAHRTLPFGTVVRVTNLDSRRQTEVTINDRGPFVAGRILDLSRRAAEALGAIGPGVIPVRLEVVSLGDGMPDEPCWEVQVGAFARQENAQRARANLEGMGLTVRLAPAGGGLTRVRATGFAGRRKAVERAASLAAAYPGAVAVPCGGGW
jgi:rare lipoprotein A